MCYYNPHNKIELLQISPTETLEVYRQQKWESLTPHEFIMTAHKHKLFFTDLQKHGVFIIWYCLNNKISITHTTVYNNTFYAIYINNIVIKCYRAFGYEILSEPLFSNEILNYLDNVQKFCIKQLSIDLYSFKLHSLASIAMCFVKKFSPDILNKIPQDMLEFIEKAFFGGRCELFEVGAHANVASFDFPNMYGNILTGTFPTTFSWTPFFEQQVQLEIPCGFIEATVNIYETINTPPLPHRHAKFGVIYPTGIFCGVFWWEELLLLQLGFGKIIKIHKVLYASEFTCTGAVCARILLDLREEGYTLAKKILNSIYGRLAITPTSTQTKFLLTPVASGFDLPPNTIVTTWRNLLILEQTTTGSTRVQNNKAIAAIITSKARCKLYRLITSVQKQGLLLYLDTDELFIKPYNYVDFSYSHTNWSYHKNVFFWCERTYKAQAFFGADRERGASFNKPRSYKRINIGSTTTPHTIK